MKSHLLILIVFVFLNIPQNQLIAQSDQIAAVYYNEKPSVERPKRETKKQVQKPEVQKQTAKKKTPITKKTQGLKGAGIGWLIVGSILLGVGVILLVLGIVGGGWGGISLIGAGIIFAVLGLPPFIVGLVLLGKAKRNESGK